MKIITESAEHHFLTKLESIKQSPKGWTGFHFNLSHKINHENVIEKIEHIQDKLDVVHKESEAAIRVLAKEAADISDTTIYMFSDCDIVMLAHSEDEATHKAIIEIFKKVAAVIGRKLSFYSDLAKDVYSYQKLSDKKMLGAHRLHAYRTLSDTGRVQSIPIRRKRREEGVVLIVEDDRFTASYATNILNKDYELVHAKTGEQAVTAYIEHAPDIVFMDIHLPGINGHEALRAIHRADKNSYVIMLSVDAAKDNVVSASQGGASGFLKKPFTKERILKIVEISPFIKELKIRQINK